MKKKSRVKSAFTIPELLAVIVILSILVLISAATYNGISARIKKTALEEKIKYLEEKVYVYATDNDIEDTTTSVNNLLNLGYVNADHPENPEYQKVDNPLTGGFLDCMTFTIKKDLADYNITYDLDSSCNTVTTEEQQNSLKIHKYIKENDTYQEILDDDTWVNKPIYVLVDFKEANFNLLDNKITYQLGPTTEEKTPDIPGSSSKRIICDTINTDDPDTTCLNVYKASSSLLLNTKLTFKMNITYLNNITYENTTGLVSVKTKLKYDIEKPSLSYSTISSYTTGSVPVSLSASDGEGSGIAGYYFDDVDITSNDEFRSLNEFTAPKNGTYYAYALDKAGNRSDGVIIKINNIDTEGPSIKLDYERRNSWTMQDFHLNFGCDSDSKTGCQDEVIYSIYDTSNGYRVPIKENVVVKARNVSYTISVPNDKYINTIDLIFTIKDNLNNQVTKEVKGIKVLIDKVNPKATIKIDKTEDRGWIRLKGYWFTVTVYSENTPPSGIDSNRYGFSTSKTNLDELKNMSADESDKYFFSGQTYSYYLKKKQSRTFAARVVSKSGVAGYTGGQTNGKGCTNYLGYTIIGGLIGGFIGGFIGWALCAHK